MYFYVYKHIYIYISHPYHIQVTSLSLWSTHLHFVRQTPLEIKNTFINTYTYIYIHIYIHITFKHITFNKKKNHFVRQTPLQLLHPTNPPNQETQIARYKLKFNQNFNLNSYREIPRHLKFSIWRISGSQHF